MLAEDNKWDVALVADALRHHNLDVEVTVCSDGEQMLQILDRIAAAEIPPPAVILLDLNLPKRDGPLSTIRNNPNRARLAVIIITSSDNAKDRELTRRLGASGYFCKPSDYEEFMHLEGMVSNLLDGENESSRV